MTRECRTCKNVLPLSQFGVYQNRGVFQHRRECNKCRSARETERYRTDPASQQRTKDRARAYHFESKYGLTEQDVKAMVEEQGGKCLICGLSKKLHVDHCHTIGEVRGLLCGTCNRGLGMFYDDPALLRKAALYIEGE